MTNLFRAARLSSTALLFIAIASTSVTAQAGNNDENVKDMWRFINHLNQCNNTQTSYAGITECMKLGGAATPPSINVAEKDLQIAITHMRSCSNSNDKEMSEVCRASLEIFMHTLAIIQNDRTFITDGNTVIAISQDKTVKPEEISLNDPKQNVFQDESKDQQ